MGKRNLYVRVILMTCFMVFLHALTSHHHHTDSHCTAPSHDHQNHEAVCSLENAVLLPHGQNRTPVSETQCFNENPFSDTALSLVQLSHFAYIPADPGLPYTSHFLPAACLRGPPGRLIS